jgi:isopentenyl phosphate kinase
MTFPTTLVFPQSHNPYRVFIFHDRHYVAVDWNMRRIAEKIICGEDIHERCDEIIHLAKVMLYTDVEEVCQYIRSGILSLPSITHFEHIRDSECIIKSNGKDIIGWTYA